jgi:predicted DNA binding CopG/RHH family protein
MTIKVKTERINMRAKSKDLSKWQKKAKRYGISLTEYLTKKANTDDDKHLFI